MARFDSSADDFLGGVVEGFYGQPWTQSQRMRLFDQMSDWGLNTYFYAPKDDLKHRAIWREPYDDPELRCLTELARACDQRSIRLIYGLSPGLDIRFADPSELEHIYTRLTQLSAVGVRHFALLFDDLPGQLADDDRRQFGTPAAAQCAVANAVCGRMREELPDSRFLFCPTAYCERMVQEQLGGPKYLDEVGELLDRTIDVLWTGPEIISKTISPASIGALTERIRRPPVIWDNLFANDYDGRRLFCGPFSGRPLELRDQLRGILLNPNNEFAINYIPVRTFAAYLHETDRWEPRPNFLKAVAEWLAYYDTWDQPIPLDDLTLLADCYYLPHQDGVGAANLLQVVTRLIQQPLESWADDEAAFAELNERIQSTFEGLTMLRDRELFYAWSRRAWELKEQLHLIRGFLDRKKAGSDLSAGIPVESYLPGTYLGGVPAKMQELLEMDAKGRFRAR